MTIDRMASAVGGSGKSRTGGPETLPQVSHWKRNLTFAVFACAAAYFLLTEHYAHTVQALPWLFVLACPLSHWFMHRGHKGHDK